MSALNASGSNGVVLGAATGAAGIATLPNTGGSVILEVISLGAIALGSMIITSSAIRFVITSRK